MQRVTISIPKSYSKETPVPLVVALHFGGPVNPFIGRDMVDGLVSPAFKELDAIIVAPDSIAGQWTNDTNEAAVMKMIASVREKYNIDKSKILLTGYSMGGKGTWYLAGRHQDLFSAAIPVSGAPVSDVEWKIPLYVIHSRKDQVLPLGRTREHVEVLKKKGVDVTLVVLEDATHFNINGFVKPLRQAVPWIRKVWKEDK